MIGIKRMKKSVVMFKAAKATTAVLVVFVWQNVFTRMVAGSVHRTARVIMTPK